MKKYIFAFTLSIIFSSIFAQNAIITGILKDSKDNSPLIGASAMLLRTNDSSLYKGNTTDLDGVFFINEIIKGTYIFKVTYLGYTDYFQQINVTTDTLNLRTIRLLPSSQQLKDVVVSTTAPTAVQKGDTTQYNANSYKTNPDANAEDLVTKMAGISSENGTVKAHGEDVKKVLVDGKPFFGDDVNAVLKNLPADVIDKIQVFDQLSEQSQFTGVNDGNTTKTINIVTKPGMKNGTFGRVMGAYGYKDVYKLGGNINFFNGNQRISIVGLSNNINEQNFSAEDLTGVASSSSNQRGGNRGGGGQVGPGGGGGGNANNFLVNDKNGISTTHSLGINYTDKWGKNIDVSGSYFFNNGINKTIQSVHRDYVLASDSGQVYDENSTAKTNNMNHRFNLRMEWKIDSNNSVLFVPKLSVQENNSNSFLNGTTMTGLRLQSNTSNTNRSQTSAYNFSDDLMFRHRFNKKGRTFSATLSTGMNASDNQNNLYASNAYYVKDLAVTNTLDQQSNTNKDGKTIGGNFIYTEPIGEKSIVTVNYTNTFQFNNSDKKTYNYIVADERYSSLDTALSNQFDNDYVTHKGGVGYRYNTKKIQLMGSVNYQRSILNSDQVYPYQFKLTKQFENILPSAMLRYSFNTKSNIRIFYRTQTNAPSISQLQNVLNNSNPLQLSIGNPNLKQSYDNSLFIRYSLTSTEKSSAFFLMLSGNYTKDYITNSTFIASKDTILNGVPLLTGTQLTSPVNLNGYSNIRGFVSYGFPVKQIKSIVNLTAGGTLTETPGLVNNRLNHSNSQNYSLTFSINSNVSKNVDFTISSNSSYTNTLNSLNAQLNSSYFNQNSRIKMNLILVNSIVLNTELNHQYYEGLTAGYNPSFLLWNAGLAYKFLKNKQAELRFSVFDILGQNQSVSRNITEVYIEDTQSNLLQRYFMLTFTYNIKVFKVKSEGDN
ncbi:MAG TPA: outer membrane beta-barrel protein [Bacteroidia bacterium]|nr:outer membrane beta-barrel protein [Bacteroidia bacterium]